jgi:hypothetical protein
MRISTHLGTVSHVPYQLTICYPIGYHRSFQKRAYLLLCRLFSLDCDLVCSTQTAGHRSYVGLIEILCLRLILREELPSIQVVSTNRGATRRLSAAVCIEVGHSQSDGARLLAPELLLRACSQLCSLSLRS